MWFVDIGMSRVYIGRMGGCVYGVGMCRVHILRRVGRCVDVYVCRCTWVV